jgi:hypothetical protein
MALMTRACLRKQVVVDVMVGSFSSPSSRSAPIEDERGEIPGAEHWPSTTSTFLS